MSNEIIRTYAAFIGAILGIINFIWNVIRTIKIGFKFDCIKGKLKYENGGFYILKIDLQLSASEKDLYIQKVILENSKDIFVNDSNQLVIEKFYDYFVDKDFSFKSCDDNIKKFNDNQIYKTQDYKISKGEYKQVSIIECFYSYRNMDGYDPIPRKSYKLVITVNGKSYEKKIDFEISKDSALGGFCW